MDLQSVEDDGGILVDGSNHGNSAHLHGVTWSREGKRTVLHFAKGTAAFVNALSPELRVQKDNIYAGKTLTLEAWVRPAKGSEGGTIIGNYSSPMLWLSPSGADHFTLLLSATPSGQNSVTVNSAPNIPAGEWTHVAGVIANGKARLYINGQPSGEKPLLGNIAYGGPAVTIGTYGQFYSLSYTGDMTGIRWWNRAATDQELAVAAAEKP